MKFATIWRRVIGDAVLGVAHLLDRRGVVVASRRIIRAYDLDGEMRWRHGLKDDFCGFAPLPSGEIAVACRNSLSILNSDGDNKAEIPLNGDAVSVVAGENVGVLIDNEIRRYDVEGESLGNIELDLNAECIVISGSDFILSTEDAVVKINPEGKMLWKRDMEFEATTLSSDGNSDYMASGREIHSLGSDGGSRWNHEFQDHVKDIDAGEVLLAVTEGEVVFLDVNTQKHVALIKGNYSMGSLSSGGVVLASDKTVEFQEDIGDMDVFYEIMCRGEQKCGTFVSSEFVNQCPKCGASKIILRVEKKKLGKSRPS